MRNFPPFRVIFSGLIPLTFWAVAAPAGASVILTIPATDNPWLAGMPNGSTSGTTYPIPYDSAPANSPAQYPFTINPGDQFVFSVTGAVSHGSQLSLAPLTGPDGATSTDGEGFHFTSRLSPNPDGSENGIANLTAPIDALVGVFLNNTIPSTDGPPPPALNFGTNASLDFTTLSPLLNQPFFIGNGLTSGGAAQFFTAPAGATRLFFGPMDQYNWSDNLGAFQLTATDLTTVGTSLPEPATASVLAFGAFGLLRRRRK
jgi:hypothetical protein